MVPIAELRTAAAAVLGKVEGLSLLPLTRHRRRQAETGGAYYGSHYFPPHALSDEGPELVLTRSLPRGSVRLGNDYFSVWVGGYGDLRNLVKRGSHGGEWAMYSFCFLDHDGHVIVFLQNRGGTFGHALAEAANIRCVWSCLALRDGREPDLRT